MEQLILLKESLEEKAQLKAQLQSMYLENSKLIRVYKDTMNCIYEEHKIDIRAISEMSTNDFFYNKMFIVLFEHGLSDVDTINKEIERFIDMERLEHEEEVEY